jgi:DNA (cytosine-5)-methyltransferase 1
MRFLSLFAGIGGLDLGLERSGMTCVGQCEIDPFCRRVLAKHWPNVWRHDDVRTLTGELVRQHCGRVDLICGGFPCQDISIAGRRAGLAGERSGLWFEYYRLIRELRPRFIVVENVAALLVPDRNGRDAPIATVLGCLAESGFNAEWSVLSACALGAPHARERVFLVAYSNQVRCRSWGNILRDAPRFDHWKATQGKSKWEDVERWLRQDFQDSNGQTVNAEAVGMVDGLSDWMDRETECGQFGNAVVPQVAQWIGERIMEACHASEH